MNGDRALQRKTLEQRLDEDRAAIGRTLLRLGQPVFALERWHRHARAVWPALLLSLLALAITVLALKALSGNRRRPSPAITAGTGTVTGTATAVSLQAPRTWTAALQALLDGWRQLLQLQALVRATALAITPMPPPLGRPAAADRAGPMTQG